MSSPTIIQSSDWFSIPGFPDYEINRETTEVRRVTNVPGVNQDFRGPIKTQFPSRNGRLQYQRVTIRNPDRKSVVRTIHNLMLVTFKGPRPTPKHEAAHGDGNGQNNSLENLRWATKQENEDDKVKHGSITYGVNSNGAKLTDEIVVEIRTRLSKQKLGDLSAIAKEYGVAPATVNTIRNGKYWKHIPLVPADPWSDPGSKLTPEEREDVAKTVVMGKGGNTRSLAIKYGVDIQTIRSIYKKSLTRNAK